MRFACSVMLAKLLVLLHSQYVLFVCFCFYFCLLIFLLIFIRYGTKLKKKIYIFLLSIYFCIFFSFLLFLLFTSFSIILLGLRKRWRYFWNIPSHIFVFFKILKILYIFGWEDMESFVPKERICCIWRRGRDGRVWYTNKQTISCS